MFCSNKRDLPGSIANLNHSRIPFNTHKKFHQHQASRSGVQWNTHIHKKFIYKDKEFSLNLHFATGQFNSKVWRNHVMFILFQHHDWFFFTSHLSAYQYPFDIDCPKADNALLISKNRYQWLAQWRWGGNTWVLGPHTLCHLGWNGRDVSRQ